MVTGCLCIPLTNHISFFSTQVILTLLHLKIGPIYPGGSGELYKRSSSIRCSSLFHPFTKRFSKLFFPLLPKGKSVLFRTDDLIISVKTVGVKRKQEFDITCTLPCNKLPFSFFTLSLAERSMEFHECKIRKISHCGWLFHLETLNIHEYNTEGDDFSCVSTCAFL